MQTTAAVARSHCVLVVCLQPLRAASLVALLRDWAEAGRMTVLPARPDTSQEVLEEANGCALAILDIGAASLGDANAAGWFQGLLQAAGTAPVVVIADAEQPEDILAAVRGGARGYIPTSTAPEIALRALSFIIGGGSFFPPGALLERFRPRAMRTNPDRDGADRKTPRSALSEQERAVLGHLRAGRSNKGIARLLGLRESTVKAQVRQIMKKLGAANRTQAVLVGFGEEPEPANDRGRIPVQLRRVV